MSCAPVHCLMSAGTLWRATLASLLVLVCSPLLAQQNEGDALLLVAKPALRDPNFARTVVLVNRRSDDSALGIIINRPTRRTMSSLFPEHAPSKKVVDPLYFGGPSGRSAVFGLIRLKQSPGEGALTLLPNLFLALHVDLVDKLIEQYPADARFYVGYAGWGPGQLRDEIERGGWYVLEADPDLIFRKDPQTLWEELIRQAQRTTAMLDCCNPTQQ